MNNLPLIAVTMGDVCGVGPEVVARSLQNARILKHCQPVLIGSRSFLNQVGDVHADVPLPNLHSLNSLPKTRRDLLAAIAEAGDGIVCIEDCLPAVRESDLGRVSAAAGDAAYNWLLTACHLTQAGITDAIATAPLNKESLNAAGHNFPGHTEILAAECGVTDFGMMLHLPESRLSDLRKVIHSTEGLASDDQSGLSIVHVTLHTSVRSVAELLRTDQISQKIRLLDEFLSRIESRRRSIGVAALNPHGGEQELFGNEEARVIEPAVEACRPTVNVQGPLPVDTLIRRAVCGEFDGVVAMYHDQGHIPVKLLGFDAAINITLGLPIVRTSPTHGTAFDRAWTASAPADPSGMIEAVLMAARLAGGNVQSVRS